MVNKFAILLFFYTNLPSIICSCYTNSSYINYFSGPWFNDITCTSVTLLDQIPYNYNPTSQEEQSLTITNSDISTLPSSSLSKFSTISKLYLSKIHIKTIQPGAFTGLTNLRRLYLDNNEVTELSNGVFNSLYKLELLNLANNRIYNIQKYAMMGVVSLTQLDLKNNNLSSLEDDFLEMLKRLKYLDISDNPLKNVSFEIVLTKLSNLDFLDLSSTELSGLSFPRLPRVAKLHLSNNGITTLNMTFEGVLELYMGHNQIKILIETIFDSSKDVAIVDFSFNQIATIDRYVFRGLKSLKRLLLDNNNITQLYPDLFRDLTTLTFLNLSHNRIGELEFGTFDSLKKLQVLDISSNRLTDLHQYTFSSLSELSSLHFDNNQISSINVNILKGHHSVLKLVSLDGNPWNCEVLVEINHYFVKMKVTVKEGSIYNVSNFRGIPYSNRKVLKKPTEDFIKIFKKGNDGGLNNSKIEPLYNEELQNSQLFQNFKNGYFRGNSSDSQVDKLTSLQVTSYGNSNILILSVAIQVVMTSSLLFIIYLIFTFLKKFQRFNQRPELLSQIEL